jgi:hypothetical protein
VAPPGYEADPAVTAAIRSFDPGVIPIWRISVYIPPNEELRRQYVHHGIGRHYPYFQQLRRPFQVDMPADAEFAEPNFLDAIFEDTYSDGYLRSGPGDFMPWTWSTYYWCRQKFERITIAAYMKRIEKRRAREAKMRKDWEEELEGRKKEVEPYILRQMEKLSDADWRKYQAFMAERTRALKEGRPPPRNRQPKPMALVGKAAGRSPRSPFDTYGRVAPSRSNA